MVIADISRVIVAKSVQFGIIQQEEDELYQFAFASLIYQILFWSSIIVLGALAGLPGQMAVHILFFLPLRIFAGGFHQDTRLKCYLSSMMLYAVILLMHFFIPWQMIRIVWYPAMVAAILTIFAFAPVSSPNKPLRDNEKRIYRMIVRIVLATEIIALIALHLFHAAEGMIFFAGSGVIITGVLLVITVRQSKMTPQ